MAKGNLNKKKLVLGVLGSSFTATGWGLYASQCPDKSQEIQLLDEYAGELERVVERDNATIETLNEIIVESIKNPSLIVEQKMEIDSLNEKVEKLKKTIDGYEDLLLYIEQGNINHPFIKNSVDWMLQNVKGDIEKRIKAIETSTDHQEADRMTEQWVKQLESKVTSQLKTIEDLKEENQQWQTYSEQLENYIDRVVAYELNVRDEMINYRNVIIEKLTEELQEKEYLVENKDRLITRLWKDIDELMNEIKHLKRTEINLQKYNDELQDYIEGLEFINASIEKDNKALEEQIQQFELE